MQINSVNLQVEDNVTLYQKSRLVGEGTSPLMAYELELDMQQYPVLQPETDLGDFNLAADGTFSLGLECYGKPGL